VGWAFAYREVLVVYLQRKNLKQSCQKLVKYPFIGKIARPGRMFLPPFFVVLREANNKAGALAVV